MAQSSSVGKNILRTVVLFNLLFVCWCSYAEPPNGEAPAPAPNAKLCDYDQYYRYGDGIFHDIESCNVGLLRMCNVDQIYQLGDSISDVGNSIREGEGADSPFARLPYGANFPEGPTGRASNGRLMIDYFALDAGLPLLPPFKKSDADFSHGINFAVAGSTALPWEALAALNISSHKTNSSLSVQLDWMSSYFHTLCHNDRDCNGKLQNALFMLGPFGGSDYYHALFQGKTIQEIRSKLVPKVVDAIMAAVRRVMSFGAKRVVVPGLYSIYRLPLHQMVFANNPDMYEFSDDLAIHHNVELQGAINKLNEEERPNAIVAYGNNFAAYETLEEYEYHRMDSKVCCGSGGGFYNFDLRRMCGVEGVSACAEADRHISWDGVHLTQEAYRIMTKYMLYHIFIDLHCPPSH